ncbi:MAG: hypothetical protein HRT76_02400 [Halieaceae bacterium]|nr:hypothetical protein [Halieaceae bacterium]
MKNFILATIALPNLAMTGSALAHSEHGASPEASGVLLEMLHFATAPDHGLVVLAAIAVLAGVMRLGKSKKTL